MQDSVDSYIQPEPRNHKDVAARCQKAREEISVMRTYYNKQIAYLTQSMNHDIERLKAKLLQLEQEAHYKARQDAGK